MNEGGAWEGTLGGYYQRNITDDVDIMAGLNYRLNDAVYPYLGVNLDKLMIGFSYDINTSQLGSGAKGTGSYELSLMYSNKKGTDKGFFKCPRF